MERLVLLLLLLNPCVLVRFTQRVSQNQLMQSILSLIDLKPDSCLSYIYRNDGSVDSQYDDTLVRALFTRHHLYTLSPVESRKPEDFVIGPVKPYPCIYVIHLVKFSTSELRFFMNGTYRTSWHSSKESMYIVFSRTRHDVHEIKHVFKTLYEFGILNILFVNSNPIEVYTVFPFGHHQLGCPESSGPPEIIGNFTDGELKLNQNPTPFQIPVPFNACKFRISTTNYPPFILVDWEGPEDNLMTDGNRVNGFDAVAMKFLSSHLNLRIAWRMFAPALWRILVNNTKWFGSVPFLAEGKVDICCGGISTGYFIKSTDDVSYMNTEIIVYAPVPDLKPKWKMVYCGFSLDLWYAFIVTVVIFPVGFWLVARRVDETLSFSRTVLVMVGIVFSNCPGSFNSSSVVFYSLEFVWKIFSQHMSMAYSAYLAGFVTFRKYEAPIRTPDELIDSKLPVAAFVYTADHIQNDTRLSRYIKSNYILLESGSFSESLMMTSRFKNFSLVDIDMFIDHVLKNEAPTAQVYDTGICLSRGTVGSVMYRHNYLMPLVKVNMVRMIESGITKKITNDLVSHIDWLSDSSHVQELKSLKMTDLSGPFYILILGYCLSLVAFVGEVLYKRFIRRRSMVVVFQM